MTRLPAMRSPEVIAVLKKRGYSVGHQAGSHVLMYRAGSLPFSVPQHTGDLKRSTLRSIPASAGLSVEDLLRLR